MDKSTLVHSMSSRNSSRGKELNKYYSTCIWYTPSWCLRYMYTLLTNHIMISFLPYRSTSNSPINIHKPSPVRQPAPHYELHEQRSVCFHWTDFTIHIDLQHFKVITQRNVMTLFVWTVNRNADVYILKPRLHNSDSPCTFDKSLQNLLSVSERAYKSWFN
jgi:hypothetical protein